MAIETKLAVILHADVVGSTQLVQRDESLAHERIRSTFQHLAALVVAQSGRAHEIRGDALVAEFQRPSDAVSAAMDFQREHAEVLESITDELTPVVRIGIAMGEVVVADDTITGVGVVLAQRLEQLAAPGGVCISAAVREAVPGRPSFDYENMGEHMLKGFDDPVGRLASLSKKGVIRSFRTAQITVPGTLVRKDYPLRCFRSRTGAMIPNRSTSPTDLLRTSSQGCRVFMPSW